MSGQSLLNEKPRFLEQTVLASNTALCSLFHPVKWVLQWYSAEKSQDRRAQNGCHGRGGSGSVGLRAEFRLRRDSLM